MRRLTGKPIGFANSIRFAHMIMVARSIRFSDLIGFAHSITCAHLIRFAHSELHVAPPRHSLTCGLVVWSVAGAFDR
jgi:hypothetical protein